MSQEPRNGFTRKTISKEVRRYLPPTLPWDLTVVTGSWRGKMKAYRWIHIRWNHMIQKSNLHSQQVFMQSQKTSPPIICYPPINHVIQNSTSTPPWYQVMKAIESNNLNGATWGQALKSGFLHWWYCITSLVVLGIDGKACWRPKDSNLNSFSIKLF